MTELKPGMKNKPLRKRNGRLLQAIRTYVNEIGVDPKKLMMEIFKDAVVDKVGSLQPGNIIESTIRDEIGRQLSQWRVAQGDGRGKLTELIDKIIREEVTRLIKDNLVINTTVAGDVVHAGKDAAAFAYAADGKAF